MFVCFIWKSRQGNGRWRSSFRYRESSCCSPRPRTYSWKFKPTEAEGRTTYRGKVEEPTLPLRILAKRFWEATLESSLRSAVVESPSGPRKPKLSLQLQPKEPVWGKRCWNSNALLAFLCGDLIIFIGDMEVVRLERRFRRRGRCTFCLVEPTYAERDFPLSVVGIGPRAELVSNVISKFSTSLSSPIENGPWVTSGDERKPGEGGEWVLLCVWLDAERPEEKKSEYIVDMAEGRSRVQFESES